MSSNDNLYQEETDFFEPVDDHESEDTLSLCDLPICNKEDDHHNPIDDNFQYFSKDEEDLFEFLASDINSRSNCLTSDGRGENIIFCGKLISSEGEKKLEREGTKRMVKYDSISSSSSNKHTKLLPILLGIPPKTRNEMELMNDIKNRQSRHAPSTFFPPNGGGDKEVHDHHPKIMKGFWRLINVATCFGGQFMQSSVL